MNRPGDRRRLVGAFVNTHQAQCSIHESGAMVAGCLAESPLFDLHYFTLDEIDLDTLRKTGRVVSRSDTAFRSFPPRFDFWIFNWHFVTMAGHLEPAVVAGLEGLKFTVVLELAEGDPLALVPKRTFDGYLALDPLVPEGDGVFAFPRPLQGTPLVGRTTRRTVPVIGSFGFGTPAKGFELLVESVCREFERAVVRINVPEGDYAAPTLDIGREYTRHIAEMCRQIAKPGIDVEFSNTFMTPEALIRWCHENDLNCFMYTRDQPGLSATTDQAILSGQPLLTLTNATFRHIHPYIPPYPLMSLRGAIESSSAAVAAMQRDWSKATFRLKFEAMLASFGDASKTNPGSERVSTTLPGRTPGAGARVRVLVLHRWDGAAGGDLLSYGTRFSNAISRSATREVSRATCETVTLAIAACLDFQPDVVISLDHTEEWVAQLSACFAPSRPFRLLHGLANQPGKDPDACLLPIIPFFTNPIATAVPAVGWLIGFDDENAPIHRWLARIANETRVGRIVVEAAPWNRDAVLDCVLRYGPVVRGDGSVVNVEVRSLPDHGVEIIRELAAEAFMIFRAGGDSTARSEAICSLALCSERPVMVDASAPLPRFGAGLSIDESQSLGARIAKGISAQIAVVRDFGEWVVSARWLPLLDGTDDHAVSLRAPDIEAAIALSGLDRLEDEDSIGGLYRVFLGHEPDPAGLAHHLRSLWTGRTLSDVALSIGQSDDALRRRTSDPDATVPAIGERGDILNAYFHTWLSRLFSLDDTAFVQAAYRVGSGRDADPDEMRGHLSSIREGAARLVVLHAIVSSGEARQRTVTRFSGLVQDPDPEEGMGVVGAAWIRRLSELDPVAFVEVACDFCLGRRPYPNELTSHVDRSAGERLSFVEALLRSPEGVARGAAVAKTPAARSLSGLTAYVTDLHREPEDAAAIDGLAHDLEVAPEKLPSQETQAEDEAVAAERTEPVPRPADSIMWVLVDPADSTGRALADRLVTAPGERRSKSVALCWNRATRRFELASGVPGSAPQALSLETCRRGDWLVLPRGFDSESSASDLPEMDVLMTARSLGLNSACIFSGAEALESVDARETPGARACERHMQALLLADVVLPVSNRARDEVLDAFAEHQSANEGPPVIKVPLPTGAVDAGDAEWDVYLRKLQSIFARLDHQQGVVDAIYYLDLRFDSAEPPCARLVSQFQARGVTVTEVRLSGDRVELVESRADANTSELDQRRWLVVDGPLPTKAIDAVTEFGLAKGAKLAALSPARAPDFDFRPYVGFDRLIVGTAAEYQALTAQLLGTRQRLPVAEERFCVIEEALVRQSNPRPRVVQRRHAGPLRVAVLADRGNEDRLETAMGALMHVASQGSRQLVTTLYAASGVAERHLGQDDGFFASRGEPATSVDAALRGADVAVVLGDASFSRRIADAGAWRGVPSIIASGTELSKAPGIVSVEFGRSEDLVDALARIFDDVWRTTLQAESLQRQPRTDEDRADEILRSLAADSAFRNLRPVRTSGRASIYERLPALQRRPLLSICISTYNRAGWLSVNLRTLFSQLGPSPVDDVEVVVVDNAATDATPDAARPYLGRADFFYHRNQTNVGMLGNLAVTAQRARGAYIWIIGDDDLTQPDAVASIISALKRHPQLAMVYLNYGYTSVADPSTLSDIPQHLSNYNVLEPEGPDSLSTVAAIAANNENFYTAIYACVFQRSHALRAFCQDMSGRPFSTMLTCIPTAYYALRHMGDLPAYWIGKPMLVVNSNVSWAAYGPLFDMEQLPRAWDLAEVAGAPSAAVDARRSNRLWLVEMMWRDIFENDVANNSPYFSASRVLMRLKHLPAIDERIPEFRAIYERAHERKHPAADMAPEALFAAWCARAPAT